MLKPYRADESGMCYLITALFLAALVAVSRKDWQTVRWIELVFGEGLSAEEATQQISDQSEDEAAVEDTEATEAEESEEPEDTEAEPEEVAQAEESTDGEEE